MIQLAYIRQPTGSAPAGDTWISVLVDGMPYMSTTYSEISIFCVANDGSTFVGHKSGLSGGGGSGGSYRSGTVTFYGLTPGTLYYFYAQLNRPNASRERVPSRGFYSAYTTGTPPKTRPSNFYWTYSKSTGSDFNLFAFEWNALFNKINDFRSYKNLPAYSYSSAYSGMDFYAYMFNQAVYAISAMGVSTPSTVASGSEIYAFQLNQLVTSLNSVS